MPITQINIGPVHPSTHGVLRMVVDVDGGIIKRLDIHIGFLHRGVEKLMETRMYMQNPSYVERLDYIAPLSWDDLYVSTVEMALGIQVKEAAQYARVIMLEFQRIASHLFWFGTFCNDIGIPTISTWAFRDRATIIRLLENISRSRVFYTNLRLGGLNTPLPADFSEQALELIDYLEKVIPQYKKFLNNSPFAERTKGIGVLEKDEAIAYGVSGPVLRASGVDEDVRKSNSYYIYEKLNFVVPVEYKGDAYSRFIIHYKEMLQSVKIIRQALGKMPGGDVVGMPIKLIGSAAKPEAVINSRELPKGEGLIYMVPGPQKPYRIYLRSPVSSNLAVLSHVTKECKMADLFSIISSLDVVMGECDK